MILGLSLSLRKLEGIERREDTTQCSNSNIKRIDDAYHIGPEELRKEWRIRLYYPDLMRFSKAVSAGEMSRIGIKHQNKNN